MLYHQSLKRTGTSERAGRIASVIGPSILVTLAGCGSGGASAAGPSCNPCEGGVAPAATVTGHDTNPDGITYPTVGLGRNSRSGTTPGSVMPNYRFLGYPNSDESMGLQTVAFADYYDPCMKRYKLIHVTVASVWCTPCNEETDALAAGTAQLAAEGAVVFQVLNDGPSVGTPATAADLRYWIALHQTTFTEALDPMLANLGSLVDAASVPWNCDIDPRTMEILDQSNGWTGDITTELAPGFQALPATPSYPPPAACN
ncbi:MAG: hypothetical protein ABSC94_00655 [Polyangiaceae bacterium]|jgi:hypothetical protein